MYDQASRLIFQLCAQSPLSILRMSQRHILALDSHKIAATCYFLKKENYRWYIKPPPKNYNIKITIQLFNNLLLFFLLISYRSIAGLLCNLLSAAFVIRTSPTTINRTMLLLNTMLDFFFRSYQED